MTAYVLIQTEANSPPLTSDLLAVQGVERAEGLTGPYDAIAVARSIATDGTLERIVSAIRRIPGVTHAIPALLSETTPEGLGERNEAA